jgi:hypothetical protein
MISNKKKTIGKVLGLFPPRKLQKKSKSNLYLRAIGCLSFSFSLFGSGCILLFLPHFRRKTMEI